MPSAILAGLTPAYIARIKSKIQSIGGSINEWELRYLPSRQKTFAIAEGDLNQLFCMARDSGGAHVLAFSDENNRKLIANKIIPHLRFRWVQKDVLKDVGGNASSFLASIADILAEESLWSKEIKPSSCESPLLLPLDVFDSDDYRIVDRTARAYGLAQSVPDAMKAISVFKKVCWRRKSAFKGNFWTDSKDRIFSHKGERHAATPFPFDLKHSYKIEDRFHYDVTTAHGREFQLTDSVSRVHRVKAGNHLNVDPHGLVR